jgi:hypothetical protein
VIERYALLASRLRQEVEVTGQVVERAERAAAASAKPSQNQDLYLDSAALNLHDFYAGLERIFYHIASTIDRSVPSGHEWHRELLRQMGLGIPTIRPAVLTAETIKSVDEFLRFRHIVRNIYAFEFDPERINQLVGRLRPTFTRVRSELLAFADFLDDLAREA